MQKKIFLFFILLLNACEKKSIENEIIFKGELGIETSKIGSNIPILESYTNRQGFPDNLLIDVPYMKIFNEQLYIADSYNKRISVFSLDKEKKIGKQLLLSIPNKGIDYQFARPYDLWVNSDKEIFVLASIKDIESYEVQSYNNQTAKIQNYAKFEQQLKQIPDENFYIFQFSKEGTLLHTLGIDGVDTKPMTYPAYLNGDTLGNLYVSFLQTTNNQRQTIIKKFDTSGKSKIVFDSARFNLQTNINETNYQGTILTVNNFNQTESLALVIEYQPLFPSNSPPPTIDQVLSTISTYDIESQTLNPTLVTLSNITESILDIDNNDRIYLQSFDTEYDTLKIRILDKDNNSDIYHTPINSSYYTMFDYFIDEEGNLYNYLVNRKTELFVLQWHIEKKEENK